jgi:hypothetical protein
MRDWLFCVERRRLLLIWNIKHSCVWTGTNLFELHSCLQIDAKSKLRKYSDVKDFDRIQTMFFLLHHYWASQKNVFSETNIRIWSSDKALYLSILKNLSSSLRRYLWVCVDRSHNHTNPAYALISTACRDASFILYCPRPPMPPCLNLIKLCPFMELLSRSCDCDYGEICECEP